MMAVELLYVLELNEWHEDRTLIDATEYGYKTKALFKIDMGDAIIDDCVYNGFGFFCKDTVAYVFPQRFALTRKPIE